MELNIKEIFHELFEAPLSMCTCCSFLVFKIPHISTQMTEKIANPNVFISHVANCPQQDIKKLNFSFSPSFVISCLHAELVT